MDIIRNQLSVLIVDNILVSNLTLKNLINSIWHRADIEFWSWEALHYVENNDYDFVMIKVWSPWLNHIEASMLIRSYIDKTRNSVTNILWYCRLLDDDMIACCIESWMKEIITDKIDYSRMICIMPDVSEKDTLLNPIKVYQRDEL